MLNTLDAVIKWVKKGGEGMDEITRAIVLGILSIVAAALKDGE